MHTPDAVHFYNGDVEKFAERYDAVTFESVHPNLIDLLPSPGAVVLDVGAGSGRDARAMAVRGLQVTAVEPSAAFRQRSDGNLGVQWINDRLPDLPSLSLQDRRFSFILCSAVLMLLPREQLAASFKAMAQLLECDGILAINLRDPAPDEPHDLAYAHSDQTITEAAKGAGLHLIGQGIADDALGRAGYCWRTFTFSPSPRRAP